MNLKPQAVARLLLAALVLGLASCDTTNSRNDDKFPRSNKELRKYLEVDDLNAFVSSAAGVSAASYGRGREGAFEQLPHNNQPKKLVRRQASVEKNVSGQQNRIFRQSPKKQRPGFFWTIAKVTYETFNDTRSAIRQIGQIINENIPAEVPKKKPISGNSKKPIIATKSTGSISDELGKVIVTTQATPTTTEFKLTRPLLQSLLRRNVLGLVRLFNIEWQDAISESKNSIREFRSDLGKQVSMYLQDNPNNY